MLSPHHFPSRLHKLRLESGLNQTQLATLAQITQPEVSRYERGKKQGVTLCAFVKLANALNVSADTLLKDS